MAESMLDSSPSPMEISEKDLNLVFPHTAVIKASAGSGKTHALTKRFVQFLLSGAISNNSPRNMLAITFSNNAAREMRERILLWLKEIALESTGPGDVQQGGASGDGKKLAEIAGLVTGEAQWLKERALSAIDSILENYSDFQVRTIDSFMASIFKASALDMGLVPDFEILLDNGRMMDYAFELFLRKVKPGSVEASFMQEVVSLIHENLPESSAYPWDPAITILKEIKTIHGKLSSSGKRAIVEEYTLEMTNLKERLRVKSLELEALVASSFVSSSSASISATASASMGLKRSQRSAFPAILASIGQGKFVDLLKRGLTIPPVNKPDKKAKADEAINEAYEAINAAWSDLGELIRRYIYLYAHTCFIPFMKAYEAFGETLERVKSQQGKVFIEDINRRLSEYMESDVVPDVYFRIGETIYHYLIDEFQDTAPIQWKNLLPLIENSLSQGGSLFVVGDTKQAIYGFRNADYRIMKGLEDNSPFASARHHVKELDVNYRSLGRILDFNEAVFKEAVAGEPTLSVAARKSGLTTYNQHPREGSAASGYAESVVISPDGQPDDVSDPPEKALVHNTIRELVQRGYSYSDIAVLAPRNDDVVNVAGWLNEIEIPFISLSSLDIRNRKITGELVALLKFLDSPLDDLSFVEFCSGQIFQGMAGVEFNRDALQNFLLRARTQSPRYKAFQTEYPHLWEKYFDNLFRGAGYLPLYDLATEIYRVFRVFDTMPDEEATLVKILETIKNYEDAGTNNIGDFLEFASDEDRSDSRWTVDVPKKTNAVRIMTVHKAKGLGFPVAIVLLYGKSPGGRGFDYILDETAHGVKILKITKAMASNASGYLEELYDREKTRENVNWLNSLYVAFTRAKSELYVIGAKSGRINIKYPFDLLPVERFAPTEKPLPETPPSASASFGTYEDPGQAFAIHYNYAKPAGHSTDNVLLNVEERQRGDYIHSVLYYISSESAPLSASLSASFDVGHELAEAMKKASSSGGYSPDDDEIGGEIWETLYGFLSMDEVRGLFSHIPGRVVYREKEFAASDGSLYRMDRVIFDQCREGCHKAGSHILVVDYKTGKHKRQSHIEQANKYMELLRHLYPAMDVGAVIAYVDLKELCRVE
ncbi:MAG: UvrD-helicase domain-containing protein [Nitrospirae bacterium]|nr:UvrD-helicase domain-containing protein [Nitrospirota bacterium]